MPKGFKKDGKKLGFQKGHKLNKGHTPWNKGLTKETDERVRKYGLSQKGKKVYDYVKKILSEKAKLRVGEKANNWQGGKSDFKESIYANHRYSEWRLKVFERDNWICKMCGYDKGGILQAHHIKTVKEIIEENKIKDIWGIINCKELWDVNNGITLCKNCHKRVLGKESQYKELFSNLIKV